MSTLTFDLYTDLDRRLLLMRDTHYVDMPWIDFLYKLDSHILHVDYDIQNCKTCITFKNEAYKSWFLLRIK